MGKCFVEAEGKTSKMAIYHDSGVSDSNDWEFETHDGYVVAQSGEALYGALLHSWWWKCAEMF